MHLHRPLALVGGLLLTASLSACADDSSSSSGEVAVTTDDESCDVAQTELDAGSTTFTIDNTGSEVTEVYVYGKDGDEFTKIINEVENIAPGVPAELKVNLSAGDYQVACKPGMVGDGIRQDITVSGEGGSEESEASYDREIEFEVDKQGQVVSEQGDPEASVGEKIEFKLHNENQAEYYLELLDPAGKEVAAAEAEGGSEAEFIADLDEAGDYQLKFYAEDAEDQATTVKLPVSQ